MKFDDLIEPDRIADEIEKYTKPILIIGCVLGVLVGFNGAGVGGALLGGIVGPILAYFGAFILGGLVALLIRAGLIALFLAPVALVIWIIASSWGVGH